MRSQWEDTETDRSWTDDLPLCPETGAGFATNSIYREDGARQEGTYRSRDRSFYCRIDENTDIYAIFSGFNGSKVADFALQRMSAEILLGQLKDKRTDKEIEEVLRQAAITVEKGYLDTIDGHLTRKFMLQNEIPEGLSQYEVSQKYQPVLNELNDINAKLSVGCSVILALIYYGKLYILNIGNCKALLCKNDSHNVLTVVQLSVDHNLHNSDEVRRLGDLGLDVQSLSQGPLPCTRCIGNYLGKAGYKDCDYLSGARSDPVTAEPEIVGGFPIDDSCRFLLLLSGGMSKTLNDIYVDPLETSKEMIHMAVDQFRVQSTLTGVAQSVVHKVVQYHHDTYMREPEKMRQQSREDITLLVRNFNFPMPNILKRHSNSQVRFDANVRSRSDSVHSESQSNVTTPVNLSNYSTNSSIETDRFLFTRSSESARYNRKDEKVRPYVDFTDYFRNVEIAKQNGMLPNSLDFD